MKTSILLFVSLLTLAACTKSNKQANHNDTADLSTQEAIIDCNYTFDEAISGTKAPQYIIDQLVLFDVKYISTDGKLHQGQILTNKALEEDLKYMFDFMLKEKFPIKQAIPVVKYDWNDDASMQDNNTYSFCYRNVGFSFHAKGLAIDINPFFNPVIWKPGWKRINKPQGAIYDPQRPGAFTASNPVVLEFEKHHFHWGGKFSAKYDYHHFEKSGYWKSKELEIEEGIDTTMGLQETSVENNNQEVSTNIAVKNTKGEQLTELPLNLINTYFSTLSHYQHKPVSDWIFETAKESGGSNFRLDILANKVSPNTFATDAIMYPVGFLKYSISKYLTSKKLNQDFVKQAYLDISIVDNKINCAAYVTDINDEEYFFKLSEIKSKQ